MNQIETYDVIALGETLIDFVSGDFSPQGNQLFEACPGGAVTNVLAILAKMKKRTAFLGKVGKDQFGYLLSDILAELGIDNQYLYLDEEVNTTLAFVHTLAGGDRDFSFYRNPGADMMLRADEVLPEAITSARIFHFGTLSMTHEGVRAATKKALQIAKENNVFISFDPNLRPPLWSSTELAKEQFHYGFSFCDILKISDNEIQFISGLEDYDEGIGWLQEKYAIPLILLTLGKDGSRAYYKDMRIEEKGFSVNTIEATGAGDAFCGSILHYLLEHNLLENAFREGDIKKEQLSEMLIVANAAAALTTTKKGALKVMPSKEEVMQLMKA